MTTPTPPATTNWTSAFANSQTKSIRYVGELKLNIFGCHHLKPSFKSWQQPSRTKVTSDQFVTNPGLLKCPGPNFSQIFTHSIACQGGSLGTSYWQKKYL
jgi:hypothetical protein